MSRKTDQLYQLLELQPGASAEDVKKAYFRLVRKYNPEKEPEKFQALRAAYEALKDGPPQDEDRSSTDWVRWDTPVVGYLIETADSYADSEDYVHAVSLLEDALKIEPENPLLYLLTARYLMWEEHWQRAAKYAEKAVKLLPDNMEAWLILANGYQNRGWYKKALPAFQKSYELGERRLHFLVVYIGNLANNGLEQEALTILRETLASPGWDDLPLTEQTNGYYNIAINIPPILPAVQALLDGFDRFIRRNKRHLKNTELASSTLVCLFFEREDMLGDPAIARRIEKSIRELHSQGIISEQFRDRLLFSVVYKSLEQETRDLSGNWTLMARAVMSASEDRGGTRFMMLDGELCLLKERDRLLRELPVIRQDYPMLYEAYEAFLQAAQQADTGDLYRRLKREFDQLSAHYRNSHFEELYPSEMKQPRKRSLDDFLFDGEIEGFRQVQEPIVREQEKVGRNDPCPCGSGKKFKKCCMGKGIYD